MKFIIERSNESLYSHSGLALIGALIKKSGIPKLIDKISPIKPATDSYPSSDIAKCMTALLCMAKSDYDDILPFRRDKCFIRSLELSKQKTPSSPTIRQRLDSASEEWDTAVVESSVRLLKDEAVITPCDEGYVILSCDVSPMDNSNSHKEGVSYTYKGFNGYAPMFAHLGREGYLVNLEFREGSVHCQKGTAAFIGKTLKLAGKITGERILMLLDSGNDSAGNLRECHNAEADFIIKRNLRKEPLDNWLWIAQTWGEAREIRPGETEYLGSLWLSHEELDRPVRIVFRVTERTFDRKGQLLLAPEIEADTYWTSLDFAPETIIALYCKRGLYEQFHSEFKSDMELERLPSGNFSTNTRIMFLGLLAYNILRLIDQFGLRHDSYARNFKRVSRRRLKSVIQDLIYMACRLVFKANRWRIRLGKECPYFEVFQGLYYRWAT